MTFSQPQAARLAELVGITPETHWWLFNEIDAPMCRLPHEPIEYEFTGPTDPATPAFDDVFASRLLWWLGEQGHWPTITCTVGPICGAGMLGAHERAETISLALLLAAQAAGVPEIVQLMGDAE